MSKLSTARHNSKIEYFNFLNETASFVDPYVKQFFEDKFSTTSELKNVLIHQYRF